MASSGWLRVAAGARLVASAAAKQASVEVTSVAARTAQHGADFAANLRHVAVMRPTQVEPTINGHAVATASPDRTAPQISHQANNDEAVRAVPPKNLNGLLLHAPRAQASAEASDELLASPVRGTEKPNITTTSLASESLSQEGRDDLVNSEASAPEAVTISDENQIRQTTTDYHTDYERLQEGKAVPSTRVGRAVGFASLGFGLAFGAVGEGLSRLTGSQSSSSNVLVNDGNADRLAQSLCRMRGAALKMGQMLSIQDESLLPPELARALKQVRQGADAMPEYQLQRQLQAQLGDTWEEQHFESFDKLPFAAASVGQCHRAKLRLEDGTLQNVVVKVQYPGVGRSIESDLQNLAMLVKWTGMAPKGLFLDNVIRVGKEELQVECDYQRELKQQQRMKELVESDPILQANKFVVPLVFPQVTTHEVITTAFAPGGTIDKVSHLDQEERNRIARTIMYLTIQELFVWRFMQTDPNWGNFLYDVGTQTTSLIDFGASREYSKEFVDGYLRIVWASSNQDEERLMAQSYKMEFLTGEENPIMLNAHKHSGYTVGEPFRTDEPFDFRGSQLSTRMGQHTSAFLKHRLTPPPNEVYTLHRKLVGAFMLCIKLGAVIRCRDLLEEVISNYVFEDGQDPPPL